MNRRLFLSLTAAAAAFGAPALAQPNLSTADAALVDEAQAYLQGLNAVRGSFTQVDHRGQRSSGSFSYKRPGKVRFEYGPPSRMVVTTDGSNVLVTDPRLGTADRFSLNNTPLGLFIGRALRFDRGVTVEDVTVAGEGFSVTARGRRANEGRVVLSFARSPIRLQGWTAIDGQGRRTRVTLSGLQPANLPDSLFSTVAPPRRR